MFIFSALEENNCANSVLPKEPEEICENNNEVSSKFISIENSPEQLNDIIGFSFSDEMKLMNWETTH